MGNTQEYLKMLFNHPLRGVDSIFMREIMYDEEKNVFVDLSADDGFEYVENIYIDIDPLYIELFKQKPDDMIIKDKNGRLTLLTLMPYMD